MATNGSNLKRYNLGLPKDVYEELRRVADQRQTTVLAILRSFIKLGLLAIEIENTPDATLLIREDGKEREIMLL
ncbi:MAG: hypothetical protein K8J31_24500 [Anaerolineae bacterium]|nr:hypothetical protein [Anaerolineae bacterium]